MTTTSLREGEARDPWILARDAAVLALCYGAGLRISEALSIRRGDAPVGETDAVTIVGKGQKSRSAPIIPPVRKAVEDYLSLCPFALKPAGPLFVGAKGGPLVATHRAIGDGADARRARPARKRDAACAPPFVRHPSSGARRRLENHPRSARPCLAVHDAGLYRSRQRAPACGLSLRPSARLNRAASYRRPRTRALRRRRDNHEGQNPCPASALYSPAEPARPAATPFRISSPMATRSSMSI